MSEEQSKPYFISVTLHPSFAFGLKVVEYDEFYWRVGMSLFFISFELLIGETEKKVSFHNSFKDIT